MEVRRWTFDVRILEHGVIRLLDVADACEKSLLRELIDKPKMREWVGLQEPELRDRLLSQ